MRFPLLALALVQLALAQGNAVQDHYQKTEYMVPARDGKKMFVSVYVPKDKPGKHPIIIEKSPYHPDVYGKDNYRQNMPGSKKFRDAGYIFAFCDARGTGMSEGDFVMMLPKRSSYDKGVDESTDTYDVVDYLVKHVPNNNGSVGFWGVSYPGYFAAAAGINSHPAIKAISPQAPCANWFYGDDVHHNGAFMLQDVFGFLTFFGPPRQKMGEWAPPPKIDDTSAAYDFYMKLGSAGNANTKFFKGGVRFWEDIMNHSDYDGYWKTEELPSKMTGVKCAVMTVGGWYDAEDQWGALNLPNYVEKQNKGIHSYRVMGPWFHGQWAFSNGLTLGKMNWASNTGDYYRDNVEFPFFDHYLRGSKIAAPSYATMFEVGANKWHKFAQWPPSPSTEARMYLGADGNLGEAAPTTAGERTFVNDPANPTPYLEDYKSSKERPADFPVSDQRFAEKRSDVLTYNGPVAKIDSDFAGPVDVDLWMKTSGSDADLVVKLIDVWPSVGSKMDGYEEMVRGDVFRCKYRNSFEKPEAITPGEPTHVHFKLNDVFYQLRKGHRLMVQVQGSWFPLVDRNPNQFEDIYHAKDSDYQKATISILSDPQYPSSIGLPEVVLKD